MVLRYGVRCLPTVGDEGEYAYITNALCKHINNRNCQVKVQHGATNRPTYNKYKTDDLCVRTSRCILYIARYMVCVELAKTGSR